jgi:protein-L-isoaspartate(D-aspartate) O-methyltransferase
MTNEREKRREWLSGVTHGLYKGVAQQPSDPMPTEDSLFAEARNRMVDSQIRPNRVVDQRVLSAMRSLPRERFLPREVLALAYADEDVPLGNGRFLMEPMVLARMLQAANLRENEHVLVVGAGTGYGAAVLAACGCRVTALEEDPDLLAIARAVLPREAPGVTLMSGRLVGGCPALAPYDLILIEGAVPEIPSAVAAQVRQETGRILTAICAPGRITQAVIVESTAYGLGSSALFDCATPPLPSLRKAPNFAF